MEKAEPTMQTSKKNGRYPDRPSKVVGQDGYVLRRYTPSKPEALQSREDLRMGIFSGG